MGYFKNKKAGEIIKLKFKGEKTPATYEQKHWNAVALWNYVNQRVKCEGSIQPDLEFCLNNLGKSLERFYGNRYHDKIDRSIKNITAYIHDFDVEGILDSLLRSIHKNVNKNDIAIPSGKRVNAISPKTFDDQFKPKLRGVIDNIDKLINEVSIPIVNLIEYNTKGEKERLNEFIECMGNYVDKPLNSSRFEQIRILDNVNKNNDINCIIVFTDCFKCITEFKPPKDYVMYLCDQLGITEDFFTECELSEQDLKNFDEYKKTMPGSVNFGGMPLSAVDKIKNNETELGSFKEQAKLYFQTCIDIENKIQKLKAYINKMFDEDSLYDIGCIHCNFDNRLIEKLPYFSIKEGKISIPYLRSNSWTESVTQGIKIKNADSKIQEYLRTLFDGLPLSYE